MHLKKFKWRERERDKNFIFLLQISSYIPCRDKRTSLVLSNLEMGKNQYATTSNLSLPANISNIKNFRMIPCFDEICVNAQHVSI